MYIKRKLIFGGYCIAYAAETALKNEVKNNTSKSIKVGKLKYAYTLYNQEAEKYGVTYYAIDDTEGEMKWRWSKWKVR